MFLSEKLIERDNGVDREEVEEEMVQCCNVYCSRSWYHLCCLNPPLQAAPEGLWFCSDECMSSGGLVYCVCKEKRGREDDHMIRCALKSDCTRHEYYHLSCIGIRKKDIPGTVCV